MSSTVQDLGPTIGALEIGVLFSCGLIGMLSVQTFVYFTSFRQDPVWIKLWVITVWLFELGHLISIAQNLYVVTVTGWGNPQSLVRFMGLSVSPLLSGIVSAMAQVFFVHRIWIMGSPPFAILCYFLIFLRFVATAATAIVGLTYKAIVPFLADFGWLLKTYICIGAAVDMLIPIALCFILRRLKNDTWSDTASIIDRIMLWTIQTGLTTGILSLIDVALFSVFQRNFIWIAVYFNVTRLYSNAFLLSLNARTSLRQYSAATANIPNTSIFSPIPVKQTPITIEMTRRTNDSTANSFSVPEAGNTYKGPFDGV